MSEIFLKYFWNTFDYLGSLLVVGWNLAIFLSFSCFFSHNLEKNAFFRNIHFFSRCFFFSEHVQIVFRNPLAFTGNGAFGPCQGWFPRFLEKLKNLVFFPSKTIFFRDFGWEKQEKKRQVEKVSFFLVLAEFCFFPSFFSQNLEKMRFSWTFNFARFFFQKISDCSFVFSIFFSRHVFKSKKNKLINHKKT